VSNRFRHHGMVTVLLIVVVFAGQLVSVAAASPGSAPVESAGGFPLWIVFVGVAVALAILWFVLRRGGGKIDREAYLVIKSGEQAGTRLRLEKAKTRIGAQNDNDIVLTDDHIARHHALLMYDGGTFAVRDLNSLYGLYVDGKRVDESPIAGGEMINLGKVVDVELVIHG
jgi:hypothetical protein